MLTKQPRYTLDSDLSSRLRYPSFKQPCLRSLYHSCEELRKHFLYIHLYTHTRILEVSWFLKRQVTFNHFFRYLDDVALHHLVDALCRLSTTSMEQAQTNKVTETFNYFNCSNTPYCLPNTLTGKYKSTSVLS